MCLALLALHQHPEWPLLLLVNRDEWHERPTSLIHWWGTVPPMLAGQDLRSHGTWLGVMAGGRCGLVTNFRDPDAHRAQQRSRGRLVTDYLCSMQSSAEYCAAILPHAAEYNGYNLLLIDRPDTVRYCSSRLQQHRLLDPGIYGLSNAHLDTPWPKVERGKHLLRECLTLRGEALFDAALALLADRAQPEDTQLPSTGVSPERERMLAPIRIVSPAYGTRTSSVLALRADGSGVLCSVDRDVSGAANVVERWAIGK